MRILLHTICLFLFINACHNPSDSAADDKEKPAHDSLKASVWKARYNFSPGYSVWVVTEKLSGMRDPGSGSEKWYQYTSRNIITNEIDTSWMPEKTKVGDTIQASPPM